MTTDPTAKHHAQILDWLSAALTDPDTDEIRLEQGVAGQWDVYVEKSVDPAVEVAATSAYDEAFLAKENVVATPEGDVPEKDVKGRPEKEDPQPYNFGGVSREGYTGCTCPDCLALEKTMKGVDESAMKALDRLLNPGEVPPAFRPEETLEARKKALVSYLERRYGTTGVY